MNEAMVDQYREEIGIEERKPYVIILFSILCDVQEIEFIRNLRNDIELLG
jgi:hypothetical protein